MDTQEGTLLLEKTALRASATHLRAHLTHGVEAAESLCGHIRSLIAARVDSNGAKPIVAGYWPIGSEIDVRPLMRDLERDGCRLCLPTIATPDRPLVFRAWGVGDALADGPLGTREPGADAPEVLPEVVLVPLLAFDGDAYRIGYGKGFYDRTITGLREIRGVLAIGVAFAAQMVDHVPHEAHDAPLDLVATERGIFVPGATGRENA